MPTFLALKAFFVSPTILTRTIASSTLYLYLHVTDQALSSVIVQETDKVERPVYFVKGSEARY